MAMELDIIKTDTTWNDAAGSVNKNFSKIKYALSNIEEGGLTVDTEMSDTSENAVQNKVIKEYVDNAVEERAKLDDGYVVAKGIADQDDAYYHLPNNAPENDADHTLATEGYADLHPRYVEVENTEDIVFPEVEGTPKKMRLRFREGEIFVDSYEAISGSVKIARLGRHSSRHTTPDDEEGVRVKKNGWRIYDHLTRKQGSSSYVLESIYLVLHAERNGYKRYKVMFINKNNGQGMVGTPMNLMGCFGIVGDNHADVRKGHTRESFDEVNCFASQIYALVIDGVYLPFRLTAIREEDGMKYGGTPLNI